MIGRILLNHINQGPDFGLVFYFCSFMEPIKNNISEKEKKQAWWLGPAVMFINLSGWIIIPVLGGLLAGRWLDNKFNTRPWLFLICIGIAFIISISGLIKNTIKEYNKIIKDVDKKNGAESNHN